jgi:hypothetical protein
MHNIIVAMARRHGAQKRGSGMSHLTLSNVDAPAEAEMRYFAGHGMIRSAAQIRSCW